jgi:hypothetical protein
MKTEKSGFCGGFRHVKIGFKTHPSTEKDICNFDVVSVEKSQKAPTLKP